MAPEISIVLPVFNGESFIEESVKSIIAQSYEKWELIIVDDSSADDTLRIVKRMAESDKRLIIVHNEVNQGLPKSLNIGFGKARAKYHTWTSDDNVYFNQALQRMVYSIKEYGVDMVVADMDIIDEKGQVIAKGETYDDESLSYHNSVGGCFLYTDRVWKQMGGYDEGLFLVEDYDYWIRIKKQFGRIFHLKETLYAYRRHTGSLSMQKREKVRVALHKLREKHADYIAESLKGRKDLLFRLLTDNVIIGKKDCRLNRLIINDLPMAAPLTKHYTLDEVIVFGAGHVGKRFADETDCNIICYIDNDESLSKMKVGNVPIYHFDRIYSFDKGTCVVIAMSLEKLYSATSQLWGAGYLNYTIWTGDEGA